MSAVDICGACGFPFHPSSHMEDEDCECRPLEGDALEEERRHRAAAANERRQRQAALDEITADAAFIAWQDSL